MEKQKRYDEPADKPDGREPDDSADTRTQEGEIPPGQSANNPQGARPPVRGEDGPPALGSRE
ncbi:MAG TPA: hypothetical protein VKF82_06650 [Candidatus Eremiobacteraceae bacterium]|nr:hypothetical protein [Candidatus Eremiobacteraceae bacterium]